MRIFFYAGMKARLLEQDGWVLTKEGKAYIGIKILSIQPNENDLGYVWDDDNWLRATDEFAPIVFVTGSESHFPMIENFLNYIYSHKFSIKDGVLEYNFKNMDEKPTTLALNLEQQENLPEVNDQIIDLQPRMVFNSPYLHSLNGSGIVNIEFNNRKLLLDLSENP